ncbi:MAG TPA: T9SS type A sorting domain-containing protein [Puia sp.]|uniref:T9SS type A sorting domain-containing protein n=1 Tax=Puia sp. TaxID=2045100 RepID=UPI002D123083|nr:T9SS type A sorting domain-containing protein [Puia sp.]HVU95391.1 T9SS type A sorting domain-containing protein [Puia sp.]
MLSVTTGATDVLELTNFGFNIPTGSTINGIEVDITRQQSGGLSLTILGSTINGTVNDNLVQLVGPGVTSVNKAGGSAWPAANGSAVYGSSSDTWGPTAWTAAMVNSPSFGVHLSAAINGGILFGINLIPGASVDAVRINITYSLPATLPLQLSQWSVTRQGNNNLLRWQAAGVGAGAGTSGNGAGSTGNADPGTFVVERSGNGSDWTDLAQVPAGNGSAKYSYADENAPVHGTAYYRLKLHSAGQADSWSTVQVLAEKPARPGIKMYPNPFHEIINISAPGAPFSKVILRNAQGATIWIKEFPGGGVNSTQIPTAGLPQGLYFLTIDNATGSLIKGS